MMSAIIGILLFVLPLLRTAPPALNVAAVTNTADFSSRAPYVPEYLFAKPAKVLPAPPDKSASALELYGAGPAAGRWQWAHRLGGVDAENTLVHLVLTRNGVAPVDITGLGVADLRCSAPRAGTLATYDWHYVSSDAGLAESYGAPGGSRYFLTHLDGLPGYMGISSDRPDFTSDALTFIGSNGKPAPAPLPISVSYGQELSFDVLATVFAHDCQWRLKLDWTSGGRPYSTTVPSGGSPFETTAVGIAPGEMQNVSFVTWSGRGWLRVSPASWGGPQGAPEGQCRVMHVDAVTAKGLVPQQFLQCF
jgi:hypothetical protein